MDRTSILGEHDPEAKSISSYMEVLTPLHASQECGSTQVADVGAFRTLVCGDPDASSVLLYREERAKFVVSTTRNCHSEVKLIVVCRRNFS